MKGSKWIPVWGMFTADANNIPTRDETTNLGMAFYHGIIVFAIIASLTIPFL